MHIVKLFLLLLLLNPVEPPVLGEGVEGGDAGVRSLQLLGPRQVLGHLEVEASLHGPDLLEDPLALLVIHPVQRLASKSKILWNVIHEDMGLDLCSH